MEDIQAGVVDCVAVKDLSRFGRDYIEAGRLIQKIFPALNVRFIAVTDHFDSLTADFNETSLVLPVKNFVNDAYCRDISGKVRSHQRVKREKGEFIGAFAVYGYRKDERDRNRLVPDGYAARVVREIFAWKLEGMSCAAIAGRLDEMGVLSPLEYKRSRGEKFSTGFTSGVKAAWSSLAVKRILTNEIYTGTMVQGRREKISYKLGTCREKPRGEWIRVEGTHEPVVTKEEFDSAQRFLKADNRAVGSGGKAHIFSGLLFCGDCMEPMVRRVNRYKGKERVHFICATGNRGLGCTRHSVLEEELAAAVRQGLGLQRELVLDGPGLQARAEGVEVNFGELSKLEQETARLYREEEKYLSVESRLEEDLAAGILSQEDCKIFRRIYEEQQVRIREMARRQELALDILRISGETSQRRLERFRENFQFPELDRDMLVTFVDRILVYEGKRICLELRSRDILSRDEGEIVDEILFHFQEREFIQTAEGKKAAVWNVQ